MTAMVDAADEKPGDQSQTPGDRTVEFGWADSRPVSGRRAIKEKQQKKKLKAGSFETLGLSPPILRGVKRKGYSLPTPIQRKAMPPILQGQDVVGMARTGSGKTAAFVIPMLERLREHSTMAGSRAVILSPTRELALQTAKVVKELARYTNLRIAILVGGDSMEAQFAELAANPDIIVATPGRLMHHLQEIEGMSLQAVEYSVFDEADRLFEMGFAEQLKAILAKLGPSRQTLLFSATLPKALAEFARAGLREPEFVRLDADSKLSPDLSLAFFTVRKDDKLAALVWILREFVDEGKPSIVFASTRHHVEFLYTILQGAGLNVACVYGAMDQAARKIHIGKFRTGRSTILVTTDVAARGLDIPLLDNVVNYDFPGKPKLFVHRAGRVARAGRKGSALSLITREELPYVLDLHLFLSRPIHAAPVTSLASAARAADSLPADSSIFGSFPENVLEDATAEVQGLIAKLDLQGLQKSVGNAHGLYVKTRPPASAESAARAKGLGQEGVHPILARALPHSSLSAPEAQESLKDISLRLKQFRPAATVLEAEVAPARRGEGAGTLSGPGLTASTHPTDFQEVMKEKRKHHGDAIKATKRQKTDERLQPQAETGVSQAAAILREAAADAAVMGDGVGLSGRYRDSDFYIPEHQTGNRTFEEQEFSVRGGTGSQMDGAIMDLMADDQEGLTQHQRNYHWDKRKRQYIQLQPGEQVVAGKRIKTESGKSVKGKHEASGLYKKWSKAHQTKVMRVGQKEDEKAPYVPGMGERFKHGGRGWKNTMKLKRVVGANVKGEIKPQAQVDKQKRLAERKAERQKGGYRKGRGRAGKGKDSFDGPTHRSRSTKKGGFSEKPPQSRGFGKTARGKSRRK